MTYGRGEASSFTGATTGGRRGDCLLLEDPLAFALELELEPELELELLLVLALELPSSAKSDSVACVMALRGISAKHHKERLRFTPRMLPDVPSVLSSGSG